MYRDKANESHVELPTSDLLGDLKDEYGELLSRNPGWYVEGIFCIRTQDVSFVDFGWKSHS